MAERNDAARQPGTPGDCAAPAPRFKFAELPAGIIYFTATPKFALTRRRSEVKRAHHLQPNALPRRIITRKDIDDISGLLSQTKLNVEKKAEVSTSQVAQSGLSIPECRPTSHWSSMKRRILNARRKLKSTAACAKQSTVISMDLSTRPNSFGARKTGCSQTLFAQENGKYEFQHWPGCLRKSYEVKLCTEIGQSLPITYHSLLAMDEYRNQSFEEVRLQDYLSGLKGPASKTHLGPKFEPPKGTDQYVRGGVTRPCETKHQCITAMREYQKESLEELRMEHYMPAIGWKERENYSLSGREMQDMPISMDSIVYVFIESYKRKGKVRYIGRLPGKPEIHVGIELNENCGDNYGYYKGTKLFRTKEFHAEIVPLDAVLPAYLVGNNEEASSSLPKEEEPNYTMKLQDSTSSSESASDQSSKCSVCWMNNVEMFFQPCGHVCCCSRCSKTMNSCPICRKKITAKHRAYLS